ncbi:hypothetical protein LDENG_00221290 [Lucifuga dentata]|nr:hypothetical protein LDENG_00221290 [Lucifuga dentata]
MELIIHPFISSRLDYCSPLFSCLKLSLNSLQSVQNTAARLLTSSRKNLISLLFKISSWLSFKTLLLSFKALHAKAPQYISELVLLVAPSGRHNTECW